MTTATAEAGAGNAALEHAVDVQMAWKTREVMRACCELLKAGLKTGLCYWGPDNIPESITFDGPGIVGSAIHLLKESGILQSYKATHSYADDETVLNGRRKSRRKSANGRWVQCYQFVNRGMAREFLKRHGESTAEPQQELFEQPTGLRKPEAPGGEK